MAEDLFCPNCKATEGDGLIVAPDGSFHCKRCNKWGDWNLRDAIDEIKIRKELDPLKSMLQQEPSEKTPKIPTKADLQGDTLGYFRAPIDRDTTESELLYNSKKMTYDEFRSLVDSNPGFFPRASFQWITTHDVGGYGGQKITGCVFDEQLPRRDAIGSIRRAIYVAAILIIVWFTILALVLSTGCGGVCNDLCAPAGTGLEIDGECYCQNSTGEVWGPI